MLKIVSLLCVVLVASAVGADSTDGELESLRTRVKSFLLTEIGNVETKYNNSRLIIRENVEKIKAAADASRRKSIVDVDTFLRKDSQETHQLVSQSLGLNHVDDCYRLTKAITGKARDWLTIVLGCQDDPPRVALRNMVNMDREYQYVHKILIDYINRIDYCYHIVNTTALIDFIFLCIEGVETDAKHFVAKRVPPMLAKIPETINVISNLMSSSANCSDGYDAFQAEVTDLNGRAKACYHQKIAEAASLTVIPLDTARTALTEPLPINKDDIKKHGFEIFNSLSST